MFPLKQKLHIDAKPSDTYKLIANILISLLSCCLTLFIISNVFKASPTISGSSAMPVTSANLSSRFDKRITPMLDAVKEGLFSSRKIFWISDDTEICPLPDQSRFGTASNPDELQWLLDKAADDLDVDNTLFSTDRVLYPGSEINYYLDESIFTVTWQEVHYNYVYTISEVVISHPSQLRRYVTKGKELHTTTKMSQMTNAVLAVSGDFFKCRDTGITVIDSEVIRVRLGNLMDTCYVDDHGDLHFTYAGEILTIDQAKAYVSDKNINFSLSFGPVLIDNGAVRTHEFYPIGEIFDNYARAAFGQRGELHYVIVTANADGIHRSAPTIPTFAQVLSSFGCDKFYTLDGGQTGSIALNGQLMNPVAKQYSKGERVISDIIYFASAVPNQTNTYTD